MSQEYLEVYPAAIIDVYKSSLDLGIPVAGMLEVCACENVPHPYPKDRGGIGVGHKDAPPLSFSFPPSRTHLEALVPRRYPPPLPPP